MEIERRSIVSKQPFPQLFPATERVLRQRDVHPEYGVDYALKHLIPPANLLHVDQAAKLLADALSAQAKIMIIGDFDADGATSVALAVRALRSFGFEQVEYLVPNRFEFGYGLTPEIVGVAAMQQPDILITVDNGISSIDGVHAAQGLGMSVIVTDHHLPAEELPTAEVIVNPNLVQDRFASKNLAGVGVIFYVMLALRALLRANGWFKVQPEPNMSQFLDLVALGTVADVVPLDHNNRILVHQGLQRIRQGNAIPGIAALLSVANRQHSTCSANDLGFAVGPRLNAAGRMEDMTIGIECLLSNNAEHAQQLAERLDAINVERREVEQTMQTDAVNIVDGLMSKKDEIPEVFILHDENWHQGLIGLVASRLKERTQRPVMALAPDESAAVWKGSARSVQGIHIRDLLVRYDALHPGVLIKFGGHAMAAGFSVAAEKRELFTRTMQQVAHETLRNHDWTHRIVTDGTLTSDEITLPLAEELRDISPWGQAFPEPLFDGEFWVVDSRIVGDVHMKFVLQTDDRHQTIDAICFNYMAQHEAENVPSKIRCVYRLDVNEYRGNKSPQLIINDIELI